MKTPPIPPSTSGVVLRKGDIMVYKHNSGKLPTSIWVCANSNETHGRRHSIHKQNVWKRVDEGFSFDMDDKVYILKIGQNGKPRWITRETVARSLRQ